MPIIVPARMAIWPERPVASYRLVGEKKEALTVGKIPPLVAPVPLRYNYCAK